MDDDIYDYDVDQKENEKILAKNAEKILLDSIAKVFKFRINILRQIALSEGFLASSEAEFPELKEEGKKKGRRYSLKFGMMLGKLEQININYLLI